MICSIACERAADRFGLTRALPQGLAAMRERRGRHDPGRVVRDVAMMLADGGDCLSDLRTVRDQEPLFGEVAADATAFRVIDAIACDPALLDALRRSRARARENAWNAGAAPNRDRHRHRRHADHVAFGEGRRGRPVQGQPR